MVQRTVVLKLSNIGEINEKLRAKALTVVAAAKVPITSVSFDKEFMKVIGDVDAAKLTMQLRKKKINAEIDTVETPKPKPEATKKEEKKEETKDEKKEEPKDETKLLNWSYPSYMQDYSYLRQNA
ncbi:hypothetical protein ACLB2K_021439 [Fragaria x ananassa]